MSRHRQQLALTLSKIVSVRGASTSADSEDSAVAATSPFFSLKDFGRSSEVLLAAFFAISIFCSARYCSCSNCAGRRRCEAN